MTDAISSNPTAASSVNLLQSQATQRTKSSEEASESSAQQAAEAASSSDSSMVPTDQTVGQKLNTSV